MDLCILISLGPVIMQCNCYLFCCSNCSSFGHWELFQVGSCLWGHFDPFLFPLSFWQVNHEPMVALSSKYLTLIFFFLKKSILSAKILLQVLIILFQAHYTGDPLITPVCLFFQLTLCIALKLLFWELNTALITAFPCARPFNGSHHLKTPWPDIQ